MSCWTVNACAKINLFLNLQGQRPDGYHALQTVMQTISLADTLRFDWGAPSSPGLTLTCTNPALATPDNLVARAYAAFYEAAGLAPVPSHIHLVKNVPMQAGLGGGSADAAATLCTLNRFHDMRLSGEDLLTLAARLGSDVPFFIRGGLALATGRGEILTALPEMPAQELLLLMPTGFGISTAAAYAQVRGQSAYTARALPEAPTAWSQPATYWNDFEPALLPHYPALAEAFNRIRGVGAVALLSGSGPAIAVFPASTGTVAALLTQLQPLFPASAWRIMECQTVTAAENRQYAIHTG